MPLAKRGADAMKSLSDTARDTAERQLRAYVSVQVERTPDINQKNLMEIHLEIRNHGQTPALDIQYDACFEEMEQGVDNVEFDRRLAAGMEITAFRSKTFLHPGAVRRAIVYHVALTEIERDLIKKGESTRALFIWGEVKYRDVFEGKRNTRFRLYYVEPLGDRAPYMQWADQGNEAI